MTQRKTQKKEGPLTLTQLIGFFNQHVQPEFANVRKEIAAIREDIAELKDNQDDLYKKWEDLHIEYTVIKAQLERIEAKLDTEMEHRRVFQQELPKLKQEVALLQKRIEDMENQA